MTTNVLFVVSYNQESYVERCIGSLLSMSQLPDRIIWFDDASTDKTYEKVVQLTSNISGIEIYKNQKNVGPYKNSNNSFRDWGCDFVHFMACDDYYVGDYFADFNKFVDAEKIDPSRKCVVFSNHLSENRKARKATNYKKTDLALSSFLRGKITTRNQGISAALFNQLEPYDESKGIWADRLFEIRLVRAAEELHLMEGSYHCYTVGVGVSSAESKKRLSASLISVNNYLLQNKQDFSFVDSDVNYLKYCISRDEYDFEPSKYRFFKFLCNFAVNINNGARLKDFKSILPDWLIKIIRRAI
jgi:glycosyltransferase involved in cell wall biosynthesis